MAPPKALTMSSNTATGNCASAVSTASITPGWRGLRCVRGRSTARPSAAGPQDRRLAAGGRACGRPLQKVVAGKYVHKRDQRDDAEDRPDDLLAETEVLVEPDRDPDQHDRDRMQQTTNQTKEKMDWII